MSDPADLRQLLRQQQQTQALLDGTDALVFVKDTSFTYLQVNEAFARRVGRTPAECAGLTDFDLFPARMAAAYRANDTELLAVGGRHERLVEVPQLDGEDGPRTFRSAKTVLRDEHGVVWGIAGVGTDLTEEVRARAQLQELNAALVVARDEAVSAVRAKSAFLATVSHELRTPLHGAIGMLELLALNTADERDRAQARTGLQAGRLLLDLLNNVLDLSRGEAPEPEVRRVPVDAAAALQDAAAGVAGTAALKGLDLHVEVPDGARLVRADPHRLRQVLLNLAGNAVKFTGAGTVALRLRELPGELLLEVADSGPGIADEDLPTLFTAFEQGAAGRACGGAGLGLSLAEQLVRLMHGRIEVHTSSAGSTFTVRLPVDASQDGAQPPAAGGVVQAAEPPPLPAGQEALTVLLVDDSAVNRLVGESQLEELGARPVLAEDGPAAARAFQEQHVDLVLLDLQMPGQSGFEVARALRALPGGPDTRILALTASGDGVLAECLAAGMDGLATKPLSLEALGGLLRAPSAGGGPAHRC